MHVQEYLMKKSDIGVVAVIYAVCLLFFVLTLGLPDAARTYPLCLSTALAGLNTLYLVRMLISLRRTGIIADVATVFADFQPRQFALVAGGCVLYMVLLKVVGFYLSSGLYLVGSMLALRVPHKHIALTIAVLALMIYVVFTLFLKVPLPAGLLFK